VRAKLGAFGFSRELADNKISTLSGGEKARLLFAFMSFDAPHMLLLDEPTNHLDIEAREALVQALNAYEGAVVIVSHDPNMVERVADRLLLVKDGQCTKFEGDLDDYRKFTIQARREDRKADAKKKPDEPVKNVNPAEVKKRIEKLEKEIDRLTADKAALEEQMAQPGFYDDAKKSAQAQKQYAQLSDQLAEREQAWLECQTELETAA
jgi:ATP-binding cassette subfamily F protein 3